ncbi:MAG: SDR family oxidoreductase [Deltaproteobacteria bacterium]|nr:SDR family oxidoreductase [Deltaproteobacteria bacterium]
MTNQPSLEFAGQVALITGGARNIGLAVARELGLRGAVVVLADICRDLATIPYALSSRQEMDRAVEELAASGIEARGLVCDVRVEGQVEAVIEAIIQKRGQIDILINNAGVISLLPIHDISEEAWAEVVDTCLKGSFLCCKHVAPHMVARNFGKIVNVSSVAGLTGLGHGAHYCAAKHGIIGLTRALAVELADHKINVNAVCPGTTESPMLEGIASQVGLTEDPYRHFSQGHLFQDRRLAPLDIARAVRWLVSEESSALTGTILPIDAGWLARG